MATPTGTRKGGLLQVGLGPGAPGAPLVGKRGSRADGVCSATLGHKVTPSWYGFALNPVSK